MYFVVIAIGCLECGEDSKVIGIFKDRKKAEESLENTEKRYNDNGDEHHVFQIDKIERIEE